MTDLLHTIAPKSDQLNADDLIGRSKTITVTKVRLSGDADQPIAIHYEGDDGKPYKPCKSMRRVMVHVWGPDGARFEGRRMTLYRDDKVRFGNDAVGGIRISHMSGIDRDVTMALTATRASRKPYTVSPLKEQRGEPVETVDLLAVLTEGRTAAALGSAALTAWWSRLDRDEKAAAKPTLDSELKGAAAKADQVALDDTDNFISSGDGPSGEGATARSSEPNGDEEKGRAVDVLSRVNTVIADMEFKSLAELKEQQADRKFIAFVAAVRGQNPEEADRVEKALTKALESFG